MARRTTRRASPAAESEDQEMENTQEQVGEDQEMGSSGDEQVAIKRSKSVVNASKGASSALKVKREKSRKSRVRRDASDDEDGAEPQEAIDDFVFDRAAFLAEAHPIPANEANPRGTIPGIISDLQGVLNHLQDTGFALVTDTAIAIEEVSAGKEENLKVGEKMDAVMRQLLDAQSELLSHQESLDGIKQSILQGEVIPDLDALYKSTAAEKIEAYKNLTSRQKYAKNAKYQKFKEDVWIVNHEEAMPPVGDSFPREEGDSDSESDIEVGGMTQTYKCPLTLMPLTNPVTSNKCNHSFSAEAIRDYLKNGPKSCPATGCNQMLRISDLHNDEELAKRAAIAFRRERRRDEDSDNDAEVVDDD